MSLGCTHFESYLWAQGVSRGWQVMKPTQDIGLLRKWTINDKVISMWEDVYICHLSIRSVYK